jgi:hypothetical protein
MFPEPRDVPNGRALGLDPAALAGRGGTAQRPPSRSTDNRLEAARSPTHAFFPTGELVGPSFVIRGADQRADLACRAPERQLLWEDETKRCATMQPQIWSQSGP